MMTTRWLVRLFWMALTGAVVPASAQTILWNSDANAVNLTSSGQVMGSGFSFELGVFTGTFVPTTANKSDWAANWRVCRRMPNELARTPYELAFKRFSNSFTPINNDSPFSIGKAIYVWGFRGDALSGEWILFRATSWTFPDANPPVPPLALEWFAKNAIPIIGSINSSGSPFLMKSAAVTNAAPPPTTWAQWQIETLSGEPLNGPTQDPDSDGISNLLEFVFGTSPTTPNAPTDTPLSLVDISGQKYLQMTVPRRIDHPASLIVQVSSDLSQWNSGVTYTVVVEDSSTSLIVRDLTPFNPDSPRRFMRLKASLP